MRSVRVARRAAVSHGRATVLSVGSSTTRPHRAREYANDFAVRDRRGRQRQLHLRAGGRHGHGADAARDATAAARWPVVVHDMNQPFPRTFATETAHEGPVDLFKSLHEARAWIAKIRRSRGRPGHCRGGLEGRASGGWMVAAAALWNAVPAQAQSALDASRVAPARGLVSAVSAPRAEAPVTLRRVVEDDAEGEALAARAGSTRRGASPCDGSRGVPFTGRSLTAKITASPCLSGTTSPRDCMRGRCSTSMNSPPLKSLAGIAQQHGRLQREHQLAVEVAVQAVVVARPVAQQQRRRPLLAAGVALPQPALQASAGSACSRPSCSFQRLATAASSG